MAAAGALSGGSEVVEEVEAVAVQAADTNTPVAVTAAVVAKKDENEPSNAPAPAPTSTPITSVGQTINNDDVVNTTTTTTTTTDVQPNNDVGPSSQFAHNSADSSSALSDNGSALPNDCGHNDNNKGALVVSAISNKSSSSRTKKKRSRSTTSSLFRDYINQKIVVALCDYEARDDNELFIKAGDQIFIRETDENSWARGLLNDKIGWFPLNIVREKDVTSEDTEIDDSSIAENRMNIMEELSTFMISRPSIEDVSEVVDVKCESNLKKQSDRKHASYVMSEFFEARVGRIHKIMSSRDLRGVCSRVSSSSAISSVSATSSIGTFSDSEAPSEDVHLPDISVPQIASENLEQFQKGVDIFRDNPKKGLQHFLKHNIIEDKPDIIAKFLFHTKVLAADSIGDLLGTDTPDSTQIRRCYLDLVDFSNLDFLMALRRFLYSFQLPGEAQKIDRLMVAFANKYWGSSGMDVENFSNPDSCYELAFATIMLNVDLHNTVVKRKMALSRFVELTTSLGECKNIPVDFLEELYHNVAEDEIKMQSCAFPEEIRRGWLTKEARMAHRRFFVLDASGLYSMFHPADRKPRHKYSLSNMKIIIADNPKELKKFRFTVIISSGDVRDQEIVLKLVAERQRSYECWIRALKWAVEAEQVRLGRNDPTVLCAPPAVRNRAYSVASSLPSPRLNWLATPDFLRLPPSTSYEDIASALTLHRIPHSSYAKNSRSQDSSARGKDMKKNPTVQRTASSERIRRARRRKSLENQDPPQLDSPNARICTKKTENGKKCAPLHDGAESFSASQRLGKNTNNEEAETKKFHFRRRHRKTVDDKFKDDVDSDGDFFPEDFKIATEY